MSACEKCGGEDIGVTYHKRGCTQPYCDCATCSYGSHNKQHTEHLHYTCRTCRYDWTGPTIKRRRKPVAAGSSPVREQD